MPKNKSTKIYYVVNARLPTEKAHGVQIAKMCEALIRHGMDVELVAPSRCVGTARGDMREFYDLDTAIPLRRLPVLDCYRWGKVGFWIGSVSFICAYTTFLLHERMCRYGRMVVYTTDIDQFSFFMLPFLGIDYVVEFHDAKPWSLRFWLLIRRAAGVVVINRIIQKELAATFGISAERIAVHPNGIDMRRFSPPMSRAASRAARGMPDGAPIVLYAGKCYPWKGLDALVSAAAMTPSVSFYLVGGSRDELAHATGGMIIPDNITAVGHQPYHTMPEWIAGADIALVTGSRGNEYSFLHTSPMKLFEYMAAHRSIIAVDTPAVRQIVSEREVFFYTPDDGADLAKKIVYVRDHADEAADKVAVAASLVRQFSWQLRADAIIRFMRERINYL